MTQRNTIVLSLVAALVALGAFWYLALAPKREQLAKLDADIATEEAARDQAESQVNNYAGAKASYRANYATIVRLGKAVPADDDVRSLLVQLEDTARADDVDFRLINVGGGGNSGAPADAKAATPKTPGTQVVPGTDVAVLPFAFGFRGRFFDLTEFLGKVQRYVTVRNQRTDATGRLLLLTSFSLKPDKTGFPNLRAEIGATSYVTPPVTALPSAGATPPASGTTPTPATPATTTTPPTTTATATGAVR